MTVRADWPRRAAAAFFALLLIVGALAGFSYGMIADENSEYRILKANAAEYACRLLGEEHPVSRALLEDALSDCAAKAETDADYLGLAAGALPEGMALEGREVIWTEESDGRTLSCRVELAESGALPRTIWRVHRLEATVGAGWTEETFEE